MNKSVSVLPKSNAAVGKAFDSVVKVLGRDDVGEILVQLREGGGGRRGFEPDDQQVFHKPAGLKIPIETRDDLHGFAGAVGDVVQVQVVG